MHNVGSIFRTSDGVGCVEKIYLSGITPSLIDRFGRERLQISKVSLGAEKNISWEKNGEEVYTQKNWPENWKEKTTQITSELIFQLRNAGFTIYAIEQHQSSIPYSSITIPKTDLSKTALIIGHEIEGIPERILAQCNHILEIPMHGQKHSLNVSVAYGIVVYSLTK